MSKVPRLKAEPGLSQEAGSRVCAPSSRQLPFLCPLGLALPSGLGQEVKGWVSNTVRGRKAKKKCRKTREKKSRT